MRSLLLILILALMMSITPALSAPFQNGGFEQDSALWDNDLGYTIDFLGNTEQDLTGWTIQVTQGELEWTKDLKRSETFGVEFAGTHDALTKIYQEFDTLPNAQYQVTLYLLARVIPISHSANRIGYQVRNQNGSGTLITSSTISPSTGLNSWTQYSFQFTALSSTTYLSFENTVASGTGSSLDDVIVTCTANCTPLPVWSKQGSVYPEDPTNQKTKSIPGQDLVFDFSLTNAGIAPDAGSVEWKMSVPPQIAFRIGSLTFQDGQQTRPYVNGVAGYADKPKFTTSGVQSTGITCCTGLQIEYSSVGENGPWGYTPSLSFSANSNWDGSGSLYSYDNNVRGIKITPSGTWNSGTTTPTTFRINYMGKIK